MAGSNSIDLSAIIEGQKRNPFVTRLILLSILITFFDGFDMMVISYLAAYLTEDFAINSVQMGNIFAAGTFGAMVGGFAFGFMGDRVGRRPAIVFAVVASGVLSIALAFVRSYEMLMVLRFLNGIALGGALPLCWALNIEYVPSSYRATVVTIVMLGYTAGSSLGAPVTIWLAPDFGWEAVFVFSGVATLVVAVILARWLPESARYLVNRDAPPERILSYAKAIDPSVELSQGARFHLSDEQNDKGGRFQVSSLFEGKLRFITPLLWSAYIASSTAVFFKANWTPLVLEYLDYSRTMAASYSSISSLGSALGGLLLMRFTDRMGAGAVGVMALISVPVLLFVGLGPTGYWTFLLLNFLVNIAMGGAHYGMHSIAGIFYPSSWRANGTGWATSIAKIGSIAGPLIGGYILATNFPVKHIFALLAVSPAILALSLFVLEFQRRRSETDRRPTSVRADQAI